MTASPNFSFVGHRALITGSSRGIGAALAQAFATEGADVAVHGYRDREVGEALAGSLRAAGRKCLYIDADLSTEAGTEGAYASACAGLGDSPDIVVCSASIQEPADWRRITRASLEHQFAVNLFSTLRLCQLAVPAMEDKGWGRILTLGSVQETKPHPDMVAYAGTKCAQTSLVVNLARQLAPRGITVNNLAPGVVLTDRNRHRLADPAYAERMRAAIPAGTLGEPGDCVGAALLLCSDAGRYITGQTLYVDGGMSLT